MRVATMILALVLMLIVGAQSCAVSLGGALGEDTELTGAASVGLLIALLFLIGGAFALAYPTVSLAIFVLASLLGLLVGTTSEFTDLTIWALVSFILAVLSFFGIREKRRRTQRSQDRVA